MVAVEMQSVKTLTGTILRYILHGFYRVNHLTWEETLTGKYPKVNSERGRVIFIMDVI